jgi:hypothetical protein
MPPFNKSVDEKPIAQPYLEEFNVAVYGPDMTMAIMDLVKDPAMQQLSKDKGIGIPKFCCNTFVVSRMSKVRYMISRMQSDCADDMQDPKNKEALDRLERFVSKIEQSKDGDVVTADGWIGYLDDFFKTKDWIKGLNVHVLLSKVFGFTNELNDKVKRIKHDKEDTDMTSFGIRWLSKAFETFGLKGPVCDAVNLAVAMMGLAPCPDPKAEHCNKDKVIMPLLRDFGELFRAGQFDRLKWVPTHLVHDSELDDMLTWLLLEHIHRCQGTKLEVMVQLPDMAEFHATKEKLEGAPACVRVVSDPTSRNSDKVADVWSVTLPPKKKE